MTEKKDLIFRHRGTRILLIILLAVISFSLTGCPAGYETFHHPELSLSEPHPNLEQIKVSLVKPEPNSLSYRESTYSNELYLSLTRILRSKYHILDVHSDQQGKFFITAEHSPKDLTGDMETGVWHYIHELSFAVVPMVWREKHAIKITVTAPSNETRTFTYHYTIHYYSWLPFLFFDSGFVLTDKGWMDDYQDKRIRMDDEIASQFMQDASAFFLSRTTQPIAENVKRAAHE